MMMNMLETCNNGDMIFAVDRADADFSGSYWFDTEVRNSNFTNNNFAYSTIKEFDAARTNYSNSDFYGCVFDKVIFSLCDLTNCNFENCMFKLVIFDKCTIDEATREQLEYYDGLVINQ